LSLALLLWGWRLPKLIAAFNGVERVYYT